MSSLILSRKMDSEASAVGAWNLGACAALLLQGVLCAQVAHYITRNKRDSIWMKLFVVGLALMITLNTMHVIGMIWIQSVTTFGDMKGGSNIWHNHWVWKLTLILEAATAFYVQMFFCRRLWAISCRNVYLVAVCAVVFALALISAFVATSYTFKEEIEPTSVWGIGSASGSCGLRRSRFDWQHDILLAQTRRFTIIKPQSAVPATLSASINLATDMALRSTAWNPVLLAIAIIANMALPQLYAWSAMWTLNSREGIHLAAQNSPYTVDLGAVSSEHKGLPSFNVAGPEPETEDPRV
ncbi:hypothetical protein DFH08DRAFT_1030847 [Mycena albidolilacea]|uniref:Uncharacterized protein n=1 Tax=Mycena albidolilacea TaxID=1033008 RepID=A0AAD7AJF5_9AGAR|nr:hypothetical protein DFH08DRAFT_1030847 [Mycena albidolilacea]